MIGFVLVSPEQSSSFPQYHLEKVEAEKQRFEESELGYATVEALDRDNTKRCKLLHFYYAYS